MDRIEIRDYCGDLEFVVEREGEFTFIRDIKAYGKDKITIIDDRMLEAANKLKEGTDV